MTVMTYIGSALPSTQLSRNDFLLSREVEGSTTIDEGVDFMADIFNCGTCGNICLYNKAYTACVNGTCTFVGCYEGWIDYDEKLSNGCECLQDSEDGCIGSSTDVIDTASAITNCLVLVVSALFLNYL